MKKFLLGFMFLVFELSALELGQIPKTVTLDSADGSKWNSDMLKDKIHVLFYVDPDKKDVNNDFSEALKTKKFPSDKYRSVAIVNLAATWLPNVVIESKLKQKQKKFPNALYIKDKTKVLVKEWGLKDDASNIVIFDKNAKVLYMKSGKLNKVEIDEVLGLIEEKL